MNQSDDRYIIIGKIGAPYGLHGWLKIHAYTEHSESILNYTPWYLSQEKVIKDPLHESSEAYQWLNTPFEAKQLPPDRILAKFKDAHSPEEARLYTGKLIAITRSQLSPLKDNEYYWSDLIGLTVINTQGENYGKVIYLMETGSNDVLVIKSTKDKKEHAIPYIWGEVILNIDLDKEHILVDWELV